MPATATLPDAPASLDAIRAPVEADLRGFRDQFRQAMKTRVRLLDAVVQYVLKRKGKEIRPTLVLLAADMAGGVTDKSLRAASLVELLHTATLVHDDVVDEADTRRGVASINALWKNKVGVLLGDYLLSRGLLLALDAGDYDLLHVVSDAVRRMSEGELMQLETSKHQGRHRGALLPHHLRQDGLADLGLPRCRRPSAPAPTTTRSRARAPSARRSGWRSRSATTSSTTTPTRPSASRSAWTSRTAR